MSGSLTPEDRADMDRGHEFPEAIHGVVIEFGPARLSSEEQWELTDAMVDAAKAWVAERFMRKPS